MLLPSDRHTTEDLACWALAEQADALHARLPRLRRLTDLARQTIADFGAGYVSCSWGKDSTVVAHLAHGLGLPILHLRTRHPRRAVDPDIDRVRDAYLRQWPARYVELHVPDEVSDQLSLIPQILGWTRYVSGVRAQESAARAWSARVHGLATSRTCRPLLRWTAQDVFGYLHAHGLPVHPAYAMTGGGAWPRDQIRVHHLRTSLGAAQGRQAWEARYYPHVG